MLKALSIAAVLLTGAALGCSSGRSTSAASPATPAADTPSTQPHAEGATAAPFDRPDGLRTAIFAGGCFWCMEKPFETLPGVKEAVSGYAGGSAEDATYKRVSSGGTQHYEAIRIVYDPQKVRYEKLLEVFVHNIDPTQGSGQFCDHGPQYRSAIFAANDEEKELAAKALARAEATLEKKVVTKILPQAPFYDAEEYHQDFYKKSREHYERYRKGCGRDRRLEQLWGKSNH